MNLYDEFYPVAVELLEEFGADAILVGTSSQAPTAAERRAGRMLPRNDAQERPVRAVVAPIETAGVDGRTEMRSMATMLSEPREGEQLKMGDQTWTVGNVTRVAPQGQAILFMAEVS